MFEKHGINALRDFSKSMYCQYGVRVAILGGYCDGDEPSMMLSVLGAIYCPHSLTTHHIATITIMSWVVHLSKLVTKTGRRTRWSRTFQDGLPSPSVGVYLFQEKYANTKPFQGSVPALTVRRIEKRRMRPPKLSCRLTSKGIPCCQAGKRSMLRT